MSGSRTEHSKTVPPEVIEVLDVGGEGRTPNAWNLNPSSTRTVGEHKGAPIPRHIPGRADAIPLKDNTVRKVVMERTPLTRDALGEILRVAGRQAEIVLRHALVPEFDPHAFVLDELSRRRTPPERVAQRILQLPTHQVLETRLLF